jgi:hypothetical protein
VPFDARVVRVLIASPGDTVNERQVLRGALEDWNGINADQGVMVLPLMSERDATPEMGDRPQGVINRQLVDLADLLIGVFGLALAPRRARRNLGQSRRLSGVSRRVIRFSSTSRRSLSFSPALIKMNMRGSRGSKRTSRNAV